MSVRVGIPRALQFYQHYPLWHTFFDELGVETLLSPPTNREIVSAGARVVADVTCLPVKVYAGHVSWLRDDGRADFVFVPAIWSMEPDAFHCAKFKGLPDIMKATVPGCPPLLDIEIDPQNRKLTTESAFRKLGMRFTWNPLKVQRAWERAREADQRFRAMLVQEQITFPEALGRLYGEDLGKSERTPNPDAALTIGLVGHPYCLYDDYVNHNLIKRLSDLGIHIRTGEMVSPADARLGIARTTGRTLWFFDELMSGAAGYYLYESQVDGLIAAVAFACGPDSTMVETINRRAHAARRSCLTLVLDEHGSATGMVTRLEAFVDMLTRQKQSGDNTATAELAAPPAARAIKPPVVLHHHHTPVIGFPTMGTSYVPLKSVFRGIGAQVELGPPVSKRTVTLGAKSAPEFICTVYRQVLGNMIEILEAGANTLIYVDGIDLCRNSSYRQLLDDALRDMGYTFRMLSFSELFQGGVFAMPKFLRQFAPGLSTPEVARQILLGLAKMNALDAIERRVQHVRPREAGAGAADKLWEEALRRIDETTTGDGLKRAKADVLAKLAAVPLDPSARPVKIGVIGEIFAVLDPFFNLDVERELGRLGADVERTLMLSQWGQASLILEALGFPHQPEIARAAKPYLRWNVSGEGWVSVGETVLCAQKGFDGMVELLPFTCEPEITALNILPKVSREHNIPVMPFIFDDQSGRAGMRTRLEAFVDLLRRRREIAAAASHPAPPEALPRRTAAGDDVCGGCAVVQQCGRGAHRAAMQQCALAVPRADTRRMR